MFGKNGVPYRNNNNPNIRRRMGYHCIPEWEKTKPRDPFDYKL